jgi:hypothetical protein
MKNREASRHSVIKNFDIANFVFGQQHPGTQEYFLKRMGSSHTVPVSSTPHYTFISGHMKGDSGKRDEYLEYLNASWSFLRPDRNTPAEREKRADEFIDFFEKVRRAGKIPQPAFGRMVEVCKRPDGRQILIDGNHRASVALALGLDLKVYVVEPIQYLRQLTTVPSEYYGSKRLNMPYQSIFLGEQQLLQGRRPDLLERIKLIRKEDLVSKNVLEIGCNFGGNCFLAAQFGAKFVRGLELSPRLVTSAIRINNYLTTSCLFYQWDLNNVVEGVEPADTVFCFSVTKHVSNQDSVRASLTKLTSKVLYFEGHANTSYDDYRQVIDEAYFGKPELIGLLRDGIHNRKRSRHLWRIEVK